MIKVGLILLCLFSCYSMADGMGFYITGISYHLGKQPNKDEIASIESNGGKVYDFPRKIGNDCTFIFNPGIGISYNYSAGKKDGLSLETVGLFFQDCMKEMAYVLGSGPRYRYFFTESWSADADILLSVYRSNDWDNGNYNTSLTLFPSAGVNYHFDNQWSFGIKATYSPRQQKHSSLSSDKGLIFSYAYIGYYF
ncbi:hypothetical protein [Candidatus Sororendozoicomonas aggregata]|uniref:hypothetical protein n=1 Tax=Candidatus Sororendozoicomonas aggregata TaxID=3073239 RepID=UPI002ED5A00F